MFLDTHSFPFLFRLYDIEKPVQNEFVHFFYKHDSVDTEITRRLTFKMYIKFIYYTLKFLRNSNPLMIYVLCVTYVHSFSVVSSEVSK